jgi:type IX secretion system PorP/SprF family membrane protein
LAFGIKAGMSVFSVITSELITTDPSDPRIMADIQNKLMPNIGFGMYYHTPNFFAGISTPRLFEQSLDKTNQNLVKRQYYVTLGGVFTINEAWKLRPSTLIKSTFGAPIAMDFSLAAIFVDKFWFGSTYRFNAAFGVFAQFQISQQFRIGLASDFSTTLIRKGNVGTYELLLSYDFLSNKNSKRLVRYF